MMPPNLRRALVLAATVVVSLTPTFSHPGLAAAGPPVSVNPGDMIRLSPIDFGCTAGWTIKNKVVVAGHCGAKQWQGNRAWLDYATPRPIGRTLYLSQNFQHLDYAVIQVDPGIRVKHTIPATRAPRVGDRVRKIGRMTGTTHGIVRAVAPDVLVTDVPATVGDSGSALVYDDGSSQDGQVIGILHGSDPRSSPLLPGTDVRVPVPVSAFGERSVFMRLDAIRYDMEQRGLL